MRCNVRHGSLLHRPNPYWMCWMKTVILRKMKMSQVEGFVSNGDSFSKHASKARDITNMRISYDLFQKDPWRHRSGPLIGTELDELIAKKTLHLVDIHIISLSPKWASVETSSAQALRRSRQLERMILLWFSRSFHLVKRISCSLHGS